MVQQGIEVARWMQAALAKPDWELQVYMENPVGSLWRRPHMRDWGFEEKVVKKFTAFVERRTVESDLLCVILRPQTCYDVV